MYPALFLSELVEARALESNKAKLLLGQRTQIAGHHTLSAQKVRLESHHLVVFVLLLEQ
jgi:hypothetical protein